MMLPSKASRRPNGVRSQLLGSERALPVELVAKRREAERNAPGFLLTSEAERECGLHAGQADTSLRGNIRGIHE